MGFFLDTAKESSSSKYVIGAIIGGVIGGLVLNTANIGIYCWGVCVDESHLKGEYSIRHRDIRVSTKMSFKVTTLHYEQVLPAICEMCQFMCMKLKAKHTNRNMIKCFVSLKTFGYSSLFNKSVT